MDKNTFFLVTHHADENLQNILSVGTLMERNTLWKKKKLYYCALHVQKIEKYYKYEYFCGKSVVGRYS